MALSRADLIAEVSGLLRDVLSAARLAATDTAGDLKEPINEAFRSLGVAQAALTTATVADGGEPKAIAYARYFVLDRAVDAVHKQFDVSAGAASAKRRQFADSLERQRDRALAIARSFGLVVGSGSAVPVPYAGGASWSDRLAVDLDADRVPLVGADPLVPSPWPYADPLRPRW